MGSDSHTALNDAPTSRDSAASSGNAKARHDSELPKSKRRATVARDVWKFHMRPDDDDEPEDWWFAGTAIPLIAATTGPLANVLSIAALVTSWRATLPNNGTGADDAGIPFPDPHWWVLLLEELVKAIEKFLGATI
ncbi:MAG: Potassium channel [Pycnora praestabilis]|nr:MAG: Potassium channel [Pycnora praestabilis]